MEELRDQMGPQRDRLFLVGGSWRAFARLDMLRRGYPLNVLHEYRMTTKQVRETIKFIDKNDHDKLRSLAGVSSSRMALDPLRDGCAGTTDPHIQTQGYRDFKLRHPRRVAVRTDVATNCATETR